MNINVDRQKVEDSPAYGASLTIDGAFDEKFQTYYGIKFAEARSVTERSSLKPVG